MWEGADIQVATTHLDDGGNEIWFSLEGQDLADYGHHIEPASDGGFIQCGDTQVGMQFDAFVRKLDADGNQEWLQMFAYDGDDYFTCIREAPAGGYVAVGTADDHFLYRLSNTGQVLWRLEHINMPVSDWVEPTQDGGFIVPSSRIHGENGKPYLYKVDASGEFVWDDYGSVVGDTLRGINYCVREDESGFLYTCGQVSDGDALRYVSKRNPDGTVIWGLTLPTIQDRFAEFLELDILADGSVAVVGMFNDENYEYHMSLAKVSSDGELLWEYESTGGELVSVTQGRDGGIVAALWPRFSGLYDPEDLVLIKWEPEVQVELSAEDTLFPSTGGTLVFDELTSNIFVNATDLDRYVYVTGPDGFTETYPATVVTLQPGVDISTGNETLVIPEAWPDGEYTVELHYGNHPDQASNMGLGTIQIQKGEVGVDDPDDLATEQLPSEPTLSVYPNPFNASTTLTIFLPDPSKVHATVYNALGQHVATLADGHFAAGNHTFTLDGSNLSSGIYFIHATVQDELDHVQKVMLVR